MTNDTTQGPTGADAERAAFENWAKRRGYQRDELARSALALLPPEYFNAQTEGAWQAWQARAALASAAQPAAAPAAAVGLGDDLVTRESAMQAIEHVAIHNSASREREAVDMLVAAPTTQAAPADTLAEIVGCIDAANAEGLDDALVNNTDARLTDLVQRRLLPAFYVAIAAQAAQQPAVQHAGALEACRAACDRIIEQYDGVTAGIDWNALRGGIDRALAAHPAAPAAQGDALTQALETALDAALDFAGTVAGGASWWDDVWANHEAAIDAARAAKEGDAP